MVRAAVAESLYAMTGIKNFQKKHSTYFNYQIYSLLLQQQIKNKISMKRMVNFNDFAQWFIGENVDENGIIEYFKSCLDYDVKALIGTEVELEVTYYECLGLYECSINGDQLVFDSIDNYFECQ